jgi:hypothetical protein
MSEKKKPDPLVMEIVAEMGEGKDKVTISGFVKGGIAHAEITFPAARLPDLMKVIAAFGISRLPPLTATRATTKKP